MISTDYSNILRLDCPLCQDTKAHLYYYPASASGYCFRCSTFFSTNRLKRILGELPIAAEEASSYHSIDQAVRSIKMNLAGLAPKLPEVIVPDSLPAWEDKRSRAYLQKRQVPVYLVLRHNLRFCVNGDFKNRVIIPTYHQGRLVTFQARDITGKKEKKYLFPSGGKPSGYLFNLDHVSAHWVVICEGPFDVLHLQAMGFPVVATFGKKISEVQVSLLASFRRVVFMWDADAHRETLKYMVKLGSRALAVLLPKGDPTVYSPQQIKLLLQRATGSLNIAAELL